MKTISLVNKIKFKLFLRILTTVFLLLAVILTLYLVKKSQEIRKKAALITTEQSSLLLNQPEYIKNEILVKFRKDLTFIFKKNKSNENFILEKQPVFYSDFEESSIPTPLKELNFKNPINQIEKVFKKSLIKPKNEAFQKDLDKIYKISFLDPVNMEEIITALSLSPEIEYAEPNYIFQTFVTPNDPFFLDSYPDFIEYRDSRYNPSFDYQWNLKKTNAEQSWDITTGNNFITVAILDTGIDYKHQEINERIFFVPGYDFYNNDADPSDDHGHGTFISGIIGAKTNNNQGIASINWQVSLLAIKVLNRWGSGTNLTISQGIKYAADNGADIINLSLGNTVPFQPMPRLLDEVINYADNLGVLIVAASGNNSDNVYKGYWPAADPRVISVGATDYLDRVAPYSNYGKIEVVAPGSDIVSLRASETDMYTGNSGYIPGTNVISESYYHADGTSLAAAHVSGLAALILSKNPFLKKNPTYIKNIIANGADDLLTLGFDENSGYGRINFFRSLKEMNTTMLPQAQITYPVEDLLVNPSQGIFIEGVANAQNFEYFELNYYQIDNPSDKRLIKRSLQNVLKPTILAEWYQEIVDGDYVLELSVVYDGGKIKIHKINIRVDNDLKKGWPVNLGSSIFESPTVADLNNDGKQEILVINNDLQFLIFNSDGTLFKPWPLNIQGWKVGMPAVGNLDNDKDLEIVIPSLDVTSGLTVYNHDGSKLSGSWRSPMGAINSGITLSDLDNDGKDEPMIVIRNPHGLMVWDDNGEPFPGNWPYLAGEECFPLSGYYYYGYPGVTEDKIVIQDQSCLTVLKTNGEKIFSFKLEFFNHHSFRSPALGDIDNDSKIEIVVIDGNHTSAKLKVYDLQGNLKPGFPIVLSSYPFIHGWYSPSLLNEKKDRFLEIVAGYSVYSHRGKILQKFKGNKDLWETNIIGGDADRDGKIEFFSQNRYQKDGSVSLYAWKEEGNFLKNYPKLLTKASQTQTTGGMFNVNSPIITDLDQDGYSDLIVSNDNFLYVFEIREKKYSSRKIFLDWQMHYHDFAHTNFYNFSYHSEKNTCYTKCMNNFDCGKGQVCGTIKDCKMGDKCENAVNFCYNPLCPFDNTCHCLISPIPSKSID